MLAAAAAVGGVCGGGRFSGSTDTSLWTHYKAGAREYCGNTFPDGMSKNQRLAANVITPTTKSEVREHSRGSTAYRGRALCGRCDDDGFGGRLCTFESGL